METGLVFMRLTYSSRDLKQAQCWRVLPAGLLIFSVALLILEVRRVEVADYLPSLFFAPLLAWLWW